MRLINNYYKVSLLFAGLLFSSCESDTVENLAPVVSPARELNVNLDMNLQT